MKLSEIKPCVVCGGPVMPMIYEITVKRHWIDVTKTNCTLGLTQMLNGSLGLAEAMGPHDSVTTQVDEYTAFVCQECGIETFGMVLNTQPDEEESE